MDTANKNGENNSSNNRRMTPEEFIKWNEERTARLLANMAEELKKPEYQEETEKAATDKPKERRLNVKESLERLRAAVKNSEIPQMDEEEYQRLVSKPSAVFIVKKRK